MTDQEIPRYACLCPSSFARRSGLPSFPREPIQKLAKKYADMFSRYLERPWECLKLEVVHRG